MLFSKGTAGWQPADASNMHTFRSSTGWLLYLQIINRLADGCTSNCRKHRRDFSAILAGWLL
jgi:hypothetical protein